MEPVRVGVVGLGWWGDRLTTAGVAAGLEPVACYARNTDSRHDFATKHGLRSAGSLAELLAADDIEAVLIATPHSTHADLIEQAAAAGKHAFVEKPLTVDLAEARRAVAATDAAGVVLQVGHNRRRQPANRRLHQMIAEGELGAVQMLETAVTNAMNIVPRDGWRSEPVESPAGGMGALGVHMIDTMIYLAGRPTRVNAVSKPVLGHSRLDDVTMMLLEFESGVVGYLVTSMVVPVRTNVAVFGTEGAAWNEDDGASFYVQPVGEMRRRQVDIETTDTIVDQLVEFGTVIRQGGSPEVDGAQALEVVVVLEGLITSARQGSAVDLDDLRRA